MSVDLNAMNGGFNYPLGNDDFMSNAYFNQTDASKGIQNPYLQNNPSFSGISAYQQPQNDTFQKQGSSRIGTAVKYGGAAGLAGTAGLYFLGDSYINPFQNGKFDDKFLKLTEEGIEDGIKNDQLKAIADAETKALSAKSLSYTQTERNLIQKMAELGEEEFVKQGYNKTGLPNGITDQKAASEALKKINEAFTEAKLDRTKIATDAKQLYLQENSLEGMKGYLEKLKTQQSLIKGMKDGDSLSELIKKNPKAFGITATETAEIEAEVQEIIKNRFTAGTKSAATTAIENAITEQADKLKNYRTTLTDAIKLHWDDAGKCFSETAPESLVKAARNFKLSKAGKTGAILAALAGITGFILGGDK